MPEIKIIQVKAYSSQDDRYPAQNILTGGKWLCSSKREMDSMSATFQLEDCCKITSINLGNCGSAFVEIRVSRTGCADMTDFLPCSTLMTLQESRNGQNKNCVKMYNTDDFLESSREGKWDQVRVMVKQPYNQKTQFGLCFLHIFSISDKLSKEMKVPFDLSKWEKMKKECSLSSSRSQLSNKSLTRRERLFSEAGQKPIEVPEKENPDDMKEDEVEVDKAALEARVINFLESFKLTDKDLDNIEFSDVRKKLEKAQGREFTYQEKPYLIRAVKKFVVSLKSKSCTSETSPYFKNVSKPANTKSVTLDSASSSGCLRPNKGDSSDRDSENVPSLRRNVVSLEDSNDPQEIGRLKGGSVISTCEGPRQISDPYSVYLNKVEKLKRKFSPTRDESAKRFVTEETHGSSKEYARSNSDDSDVQELIECPICLLHYGADVIERHCSGCNRFVEKESVEDDGIPLKTCPVCFQDVSSAILDVHVAKCARDMFGD